MLFQHDTPINRLLNLAVMSVAGGKAVEATAEGNPLTFNTNVAKPLKGLTIPFTPVQSGSGDPSPDNVRPISGWTGVTAWQTGNNLLSYTVDRVVSVPNYNHDKVIRLNAGITYTFSFDSISNASNWRTGIILYDADGTQIYNGNDVTCTPAGAWSAYETGRYYVNTSNGTIKTISFSVSTNCFVRIIFLLGDTTSGSVMNGARLNVGDTATPYTPYTGSTVNVTFPALGKNLIPDGTDTAKGYMDNGYLYDGGFNPNENYYTSEYFAVKPNTSYVMSIENNVPNAPSAAFYDQNKTYISSIKFNGNSPVLITTPSNAVYSRCPQRKTGGMIQFEEGTTATPILPYTNTVYGGELDLVSGLLTVEWETVDMGSIGYWLDSETATRQTWRISAPIYQQPTADNKLYAMCSEFKQVKRTDVWSPYSMSYTTSGTSMVPIINFSPSTYADASEVKTAMDGVKLCYRIATPYTIQLTPTEITALLGDNVIWSDTNGTNTAVYLKKG